MDVIVTSVKLSDSGVALAILDSERVTIEKLLVAALRERDSINLRIADLEARRANTVSKMTSLINRRS